MKTIIDTLEEIFDDYEDYFNMPADWFKYDIISDAAKVKEDFDIGQRFREDDEAQYDLELEIMKKWAND